MLFLVHEIPIQLWIAKSLPNMMGLFKCLQIMNVWKKIFPLMFTSHLALSNAPKLSPDAPTMCGMLDVSSFWICSVLYIFLT